MLASTIKKQREKLIYSYGPKVLIEENDFLARWHRSFHLHWLDQNYTGPFLITPFFSWTGLTTRVENLIQDYV